METITSSIEPLLQRAEEYGKTTLELLKLKSLDKVATLAAALISRLILISILVFFVFTLTVAIALWLGDELGKNYYGFLIVASFYALLGIVLFLVRPFIKTSVNNSIVKQLLN
jgi:hypothetical protein